MVARHSPSTSKRAQIGDEEDQSESSRFSTSGSSSPSRRGLSSLRGNRGRDGGRKLKAQDSVYGNFGRLAVRGYSGKVCRWLGSLVV
jgi:hypothetical protein